MNRFLTILAAFLCAGLLAGCGTVYQPFKTADLFPDNGNYTMAYDPRTGDLQHWFGVGYNFPKK